MSSNDVALFAKNLSKCYPIYSQPKDRLKQYLLPPVQGVLGLTKRQYFSEYWALRDISFEIRRGETVGIIGRNGAGKSTLLQILCGTLKQTDGEYLSYGRIAALLELGSGFNPEFTGRENVYLNASILGLKKEQIDERFDLIAAFADIGNFIDQPVKTYSSGMYVRLAFAVIAHVDADILVVDEALAVGDAIFTQKCMRFIRKFQENGTLLFVSHDTSSVQNLCRNALWLDQGRVREYGNSKVVCESYLQYTLQALYGDDVALQSNSENASITKEKTETPIVPVGASRASTKLIDGIQSAVDNLDNNIRYGYLSSAHFLDNLFAAKGFFTGDAEILKVKVENLSVPSSDAIFRGWDRVRLKIFARANVDLARPIIGFLVRDKLGQDLLGENTLLATERQPYSVSERDVFCATFEFVLPMLKDGEYTVMCSVADGDLHNNVQHHWLHDALLLHVRNSSVQYGLVGVPFMDISVSTVSSWE